MAKLEKTDIISILSREAVLELDKILNFPKEDYHIVAYISKDGIRPFYIINKDITH